MAYSDKPQVMTADTFQELGTGHVAYVKPMASEEVNTLFPNAPKLEAGIRLWVLVGADGAPIMLSDDRASVIADAVRNDLQTVALH